VRHLIVVRVGADNEAKNGAQALVDKHKYRTQVWSIAHFGFNNVKEMPMGAMVKGNPGDAGHSEPHHVGAYFIFHYGAEMEGTYSTGFEGKTSADAAVMAKLFWAVAYKLAGAKGIGKLCLVACKVTGKKVDSEPFFGEYFCENLAKLCASESVDPPLISGWDSFVTIATPTNRFGGRRGAKFTNPNEAGRKVAVGKSGSDYQWAKDVKDQHKWVWVWDKSEGKVIKKRAADSNWSATVNAQQTPDLHTALIPVQNPYAGMGSDSALEAGMSSEFA